MPDRLRIDTIRKNKLGEIRVDGLCILDHRLHWRVQIDELVVVLLSERLIEISEMPQHAVVASRDRHWPGDFVKGSMATRP